MRTNPEPEQTPDGPVYEGRHLDRPDDEVVDQGVRFDLRTLVSRRGVLGIVGLGAGAVALAACTTDGASTTTTAPTVTATPTPTPSSSATSTATITLPSAEIPDETAGPYPGDGSNGPDVLEESGIVRSDIRSSLDGGATATGVPLTFSITVTDMANGDAPFEGAAASSGRWPHIHFEVYPDLASTSDAGDAIATSQMAPPEEACNAVYAMIGWSVPWRRARFSAMIGA